MEGRRGVSRSAFSGPKPVQRSAEEAETTPTPLAATRKQKKEKTAATFGLAGAPAAKLCALGRHRAQIAARQPEEAERQPRRAVGEVERREGWREQKKVLANKTKTLVVAEPLNAV